MRLELVTAATQEPVTLEELKRQLRVTSDDDDEEIKAFGGAAREEVEDATGRVLVTQTWDMHLDEFPDGSDTPIEIPLPPCQSVTSVTYYDSSNVLQTWGTAYYVKDYASKVRKARIFPASGQSWPSTYDRPSAVTVRFVAGYGAPTVVPQRLKQAIRVLASTYYEHREDVTQAEVRSLPGPACVERLVGPYKVDHFS
jgi:uncharacterized phiE125 gp8 family phage protein